MPSMFPTGDFALGKLRAARGDADIEWAANRLTGYILLPDTELDTVQVHLNGVPAGSGEVVESRQDVIDFFRHIPHARRAGYRVALAPGKVRRAEINRASVIGCQGGRPVARVNTLLFSKHLIPAIPIPPAALIEKTQGGHDRDLYKILGFRYYHQFMDAISRQRDPGSVGRILDWGCGSGRLAANFLAAPRGPRVFGCDIDADAIAWCKERLPRGEFTRLDLEPVLPYADATFDVVISLAVLAGFGPDAYRVWLPEVRRVLAPDGLFLASVQGAFTAAFVFPPADVPRLLKDGIFDGGPAPETGQWRGFYVTPEYFRCHWSREFEVLEHLEGEINADQDLLVMRRRGTGGA